MNQSVWPEGGITALIGQARVRGSAGAPGGSPKENLELFSEMGEMDARQPKQQLSGKERVPPSGMKAEIKGVSIYQDRKGWELGTWPPARRTLLHSEAWSPSWVFHHPCWFPVVGRPVRNGEELEKPSPKFEGQVLARK